jgi:Alkylmercury lyase
MPQNVPSFEWTDDALRLRQFVYEHWCDKGVGPNLRDVHEALGLHRRQIVQAYKQLQLGIICVVQEDTQNCNLIKFQPFSSFPSQVQAFIDDRFHSYIGCAMESMAVSRMPPFLGKDIRLESWCACCFDPISLTMRDGEVVTQSPGDVLIHVTSSPYDWGNIDITAMCDTMNFVIDATHAERYERQVQRRGVLVTIDQGRMFVHGTAKHRMHNYHWPPSQMIPEIIIQGIEALGVDVTNWKG